MILAIDPGREKCGLAILDLKQHIIEKTIVARDEIKTHVPFYVSKYRISTLIVGKGSFGKDLEKELSRLDLKTNIIFVSEKYSTLQARKRYWKDNRPKGLARLIPTSLRVPPVPVDDYAAVILGERYLKG
jgi:RNase H-fold protein (predicted Holliday junction resolvase)